MRFKLSNQRSIDCLTSFSIEDRHDLVDGEQLMEEAMDWCEERFPTVDRADRTRWYAVAWTIRFRNEADAFEFRMRWC